MTAAPKPQPVYIHVGFANTGTTSLQRNFFGERDDLFLVGEPYGERGGLFTAIKSVEDFNFDTPLVAGLVKALIADNARGRTIVISDETLCEPPQLYISRYAMPRDIVALRLREFFPAAKVIFTIRDQRNYALSMYFNLKRNSAKFDGMPVPPFSHWLAQHLEKDRSYYLQNLNFLEAIRLYEEIFGHENILMLPLELLIHEGIERYLGTLCAFMGLRLDRESVRNYSRIHNQRMSARLELAAELSADKRFARLFAELRQSVGEERFDAALDEGARASIDLSPEDEQKIRCRVAAGNYVLARKFGLDLAQWGYPIADPHLHPEQIQLAEQELGYDRDTVRLRAAREPAQALEQRRLAEIAALRLRLHQATAELDRVGSSPVWRTVKRVDGARRALSRAATAILGLA